MFGRATFEVQLFKNGRWAISEVCKGEVVALKKAKDLLALKTTVGVRVVKESTSARGLTAKAKFSRK